LVLVLGGWLQRLPLALLEIVGDAAVIGHTGAVTEAAWKEEMEM
jgi:hypothetical protein